MKGRQATRRALETRARKIIDDALGYDADTRLSISNALTDFNASLTTADELRDLIKRAEAGDAILDIACVEAGYVDAARSLVALIDSSYVPDFIRGAITVALNEAGRGTGVRLWVEVTEGVEESGGFSVAVLSRFLASHSMFDLKLEPARDLAGLLSAVLNHPDLPGPLGESIGDGVNDLFNELHSGAQKRVEYGPEYLGALLRVAAEQGGE